jgi:hypothetical protein
MLKFVPVTYLRLPLGITKPSLEYFLPMVHGQLCGISDFLNYGGKLEINGQICAIISTHVLHLLPWHSSDYQGSSN